MNPSQTLGNPTYPKTRVDFAYHERDRVVALAAVLAIRLGFDAWIGPVNDAQDDFHYACYVELPTGQCSWHLHDSELHLFSMLPYRDPSGWKSSEPEKYGLINSYNRWALHDEPRPDGFLKVGGNK